MQTRPYMTRDFWVDALERAVKTFLQTGLALGGGSQVTNFFSLDITWGTVLQVALSAAILSVVTSLISGLTPPTATAGFFTPPGGGPGGGLPTGPGNRGGDRGGVGRR